MTNAAAEGDAPGDVLARAVASVACSDAEAFTGDDVGPAQREALAAFPALLAAGGNAAAITAAAAARLARLLRDSGASRAPAGSADGAAFAAAPAINVAVHVRRGDMVYRNFHKQLSPDAYYANAMLQIVQLLRRDAAAGADGAGGAMSASDELKVKKEYMKFRKAYVERKRNCMEILGNISEGTGKRVKALMEEIGLECDEDYGVVKNQFPPI